MQRSWPRPPLHAWMPCCTPNFVDGHAADIPTNPRVGYTKNIGAPATEHAPSRATRGTPWGNTPPHRSDDTQRSRAHGVRMTAIGSTGRRAWANIRKPRKDGPSFSRGNRDAALDADCTSGRGTTSLNSTTSNPLPGGAMGNTVICNSCMDIAMTKRLRTIKQSTVLVTKAKQLRSRMTGNCHVRF